MGFFETRDILMAAFLRVRGRRLVELRPGADARAVFVFVDEPGIAADAQAFLADDLVPVRSLARNMAQLRSRCRDLRRGQMEGNGQYAGSRSF
ncbi:MAG TPA: hypothetical protein VNK82_05910 [Terriglobales bacterium]|nr:hypothetical protein [Terriglobales bacterium]